MLGGNDGQPHDYRLTGEAGSRALKTKEFGIAIAAGDRLEIRSGGGGGWGDPARRSVEARQHDAIHGYVAADEPSK